MQKRGNIRDRAPTPVRLLAVQALVRVERSSHEEDLLSEADQHSLSPRDRALWQELVLGTLRQRGYLDWLLEQATAHPLRAASAWARNTLRLAAYQIMFTRVPPHASVDEAVRLGKQTGAAGGRFVNAVLRALLRKKDAMQPPAREADPVKHLAITTSHPSWLVRRWLSRFGPEATERLLLQNNRIPPLTLRVHPLRISRDQYLRVLQEAGVAVRPASFAPEGVIVETKQPIAGLPGYTEGWFVVQDEGAQLIGHCLDPRPGERVLDACAAPGGKTTQLAALMGDRGEVVAGDRDPHRLARVEESCRRLGLTSVRTLSLDWENPPEAETAGLLAEGFDKVLLDAPCSGLGVLRRHPEGKWGKSAALIGRMAAVQRRLLARLAQRVKPGGVLLYATCSTEEEENDAVVNDFLSQHPEFRLENLREILPPSCHPLLTPEGALKTYPALADMDEFYAARLRRRPQ